MKTSEVVLDAVPLGSASSEEDRELYLLLGGFAFFQAIVAACRVDLFGYLAKTPGASLSQVVAGLHIPSHSARVLLLACSALRLIRRDADGGYTVAPVAERAFLPDRPGTVRPLLEAFDRLHYPALAFTTEAIKSGKNAGLQSIPGSGTTLYARLAENPELEGVFHDWMRYLDGIGHSWLLVPELASARQVMDVGGGTGPNALLLKQLYPDVRVTIFDLPSVCAAVEKKIPAWGAAARGIETQAGDFLIDPFPVGADLLLFIRIFNIYAPDVNARLLRKCWEYLPSGGQVVVSSLVANDDETGPLSAAHLSLYFHVLATGAGMVYPLSEYAAWFESAGFKLLRVYSVGRDRILVAEK